MATSTQSAAISLSQLSLSSVPSFTGGCVCNTIRYRLTRTPLFVHCCHCTYCQRETGSAFVLNAIIEAEFMELLPPDASRAPPSGEVGLPTPLMVNTPSESKMGQLIARCPKCYVAIWSEYGGNPVARFVRVGTLDDPNLCSPSIQIYTNTKQNWVNLDSEEKRGVSICKEYYVQSKEWPKESLERREKIKDKILAFSVAAEKALIERKGKNGSDEELKGEQEK